MAKIKKFPKDKGLDHTLDLIQEGYLFIGRRTAWYHLDDHGDKERFNEEVRRYYPFAPFIGAKVKKNFIWRGYAFKKGTLVLLDLYGTNHDERLWEAPYKFNPDRYKKEKKTLYNFMPQGGGSIKGHRCVGERITMAMMNMALDVLVNKVSYELPPQDLSYSMSKIPTLPASGVIMKHIKIKQ